MGFEFEVRFFGRTSFDGPDGFVRGLDWVRGGDRGEVCGNGESDGDCEGTDRGVVRGALVSDEKKVLRVDSGRNESTSV